MDTNYEDIAPSLKDYKIENDGIWLSWDELWRIDAVACRNGMKAMSDAKKGEAMGETMFNAYVGQRMLIEELAELVRPGYNNTEEDE